MAYEAPALYEPLYPVASLAGAPALSAVEAAAAVQRR
jgi:hypothetical protein